MDALRCGSVFDVRVVVLDDENSWPHPWGLMDPVGGHSVSRPAVPFVGEKSKKRAFHWALFSLWLATLIRFFGAGCWLLLVVFGMTGSWWLE